MGPQTTNNYLAAFTCVDKDPERVPGQIQSPIILIMLRLCVMVWPVLPMTKRRRSLVSCALTENWDYRLQCIYK